MRPRSYSRDLLQVVGLQHWATVELRSIQLEHWIWMTRNLSGKKLKNALTDAGYFYTQKSSFYHEIWHSVRTIWDWQERCGHVGVWSIVGDLIGVLQLVELVGDDSWCAIAQLTDLVICIWPMS